MAIRITHVRLSGGNDHQHITHLAWVNDADTGQTGSNTRAEIVTWIEDKKGQAYTGSGSARAWVGVVTPDYGPKYLRTYADGQWSNNLLALPRF